MKYLDENAYSEGTTIIHNISITTYNTILDICNSTKEENTPHMNRNTATCFIHSTKEETRISFATSIQSIEPTETEKGNKNVREDSILYQRSNDQKDKRNKSNLLAGTLDRSQDMGKWLLL